MVTIQDIIKSFKDEGLNDITIANKLGISQPMVSQYKRGFKASLDVARRIYKNDGTVVYPFSREAVERED